LPHRCIIPLDTWSADLGVRGFLLGMRRSDPRVWGDEHHASWP